MNGLIEKLNSIGASNIALLLNSDAVVSTQIFKWIKNESGIDLYTAGSNGENLTQTQLNKLRDIDLKFSIKFTPKTTTKSEQFLKLVGPFSGLTVVIFCIMLDSYIVYTIMGSTSIIQGIEQLNAFVTLVTGYYHAKAGEIISYWFGSSSQVPLTPATPQIRPQQNVIVPTAQTEIITEDQIPPSLNK